MKGLKEKVVIVTGGCGGIGAALCERFAQEGAKVAIFDLNAEGAGQVAGRIQAEGGVAASYGVDITDYPAVAAAVAGSKASWARSTCWSTTPAGTTPRGFSIPSRRCGTRSSIST